MSNAIITVEEVSKRYIIGHQTDQRDALRHVFENAFRSPFQWLRARAAKKRAEREDFWALKDVSFEIEKGDVVGIIGRNGAGKSTLLKILSRITEPTSGRITLNGRVASLLEVGTGFHQELTGRENIFLNGAILGMSKSEIRRKFDEIVAFSEIDKFLDTPVKRYSSGMYVRLAFAVAAHLEPEILIVDEVLAVGDAAFQKKCLGKMGQVAKDGRTVLFVSHNMPAVQALCSKAIYLHRGTVRAVGEVNSLLSQYTIETSSSQTQQVKGPIAMGPNLKLLEFGFSPNHVECGQPLGFHLTFHAENTVTFIDLALLVNTAQGTRVSLIDLRLLGLPYTVRAGETWRIKGRIASLPLVDGDYSVGMTVNIGSSYHENLFELAGFNVSARPVNTGYAPYHVVYRGVVELETSATSLYDSAASSPVSISSQSID